MVPKKTKKTKTKQTKQVLDPELKRAAQRYGIELVAEVTNKFIDFCELNNINPIIGVPLLQAAFDDGKFAASQALKMVEIMHKDVLKYRKQ